MYLYIFIWAFDGGGGGGWNNRAPIFLQFRATTEEYLGFPLRPPPPYFWGGEFIFDGCGSPLDIIFEHFTIFQ